jgi:hypothetical protein
MSTSLDRRTLLASASLMAMLGLMLPSRVLAEERKKAILYKNPQCSCCAEHAKYLDENGFDVEVKETFDLPSVKREHGVPAALEGCHTILVGAYVVEGHVPADIIKRLLAEKPAIKGISLPGMPMGSPGMGGEKAGPFTIYEIGDCDGPAKVYATE